MDGGFPSTEEILRGVHALYNSSNLEEKEKASKWLTELQKSVSSFI